jgi:hypothetical protein
MTADWNKAGSTWQPKGRGVCACLAVVAFMVSAAAAQDAQPDPPTPLAPPSQLVPPQAIPPQGAAPSGAPQQPPAFQPGFLDALGRWMGDSKSKLDEQFKTTTEAAKDAARDATGAAGEATGVILGLPGTRVVLGRERCPVAANGGADCAPAANTLCRSKGYGGGRGLDINSAQKCPSWMWLSGRQPVEGTCPTETFVTRAVCQ